jgi:type I restriction enzyme M protein
MSDKLNMENNKMITDISDRIWLSLNLFRGEISTEDYHFILFLLYKKKNSTINDIIEDRTNFDDLFKIKFDDSNEFSFQKKKSPEQIIEDYYASIIKEIPFAKLEEIVSTINTIDERFIQANFIELFDVLLYKYYNSLGRYSGESLLPKEISRFMINLANLKPNSSIYNPFAGPASLGVLAKKETIYVGQEINIKNRIIGMLRLLITDSFDTKYLLSSDSITNWNPSNNKFDLVVASPPFGARLPSGISGKWGTIRNFENFTIEKGLESLNKNGKLIIHVPDNFLFSSGQVANLRYHLIEEDLIESVISFPNGILHHTSIKTSILVINKAKISKGFINFIIADEFVNNGTNRNKILQDLDFYTAISKGKDNDFIKKVSIDEVCSNGRVLNCNRYFLDKIQGTKLVDILQPLTGQRNNLPEIGKLVKFRDLKDDNLDFNLDYEKVEEIALNRPDVRQIQESCFLFALSFKRLKPTYFDFKGNPIFVTNDILPVKIKKSKVDEVNIAYLINELQADYVQKQLDSYRLGTAMPFIRKSDLLEVVIKLPSIEEQRTKDHDTRIYELSDKIKILKEERNALAHGKNLKQFNEFASLKHTLGRPRQNILDWSDNLLDFLTKKKVDFEALNKDFSEFYDIDIISALEEIKRDINFITDVLEKGENGLILSEYEKKVISLSDVNSIINDLSNNGFNFKIKPLLLKSEKLKERGIYANKTLFKTLLDNILTNANKYAFDKKAPGNELVIELTEIDDSLLIEIRNNGKPFPKNFDREKFITKYSTADSSNGSGLGGYDIHRIASDFNNPDWILSLNEDPFFLVKFKFQFPIKLIN